MRLPNLAIAAILLVYGGLASQYALRTPLWQVPDEPAHYNYVAQVAGWRAGRSDKTGQSDQYGPPELPIIAPGDWSADLLERLKAAHFPKGVAMGSIQYEDHQPPAYYVLAAVVYRLAGTDDDPTRRVHAIRLLGVLLGAVTVWLAWRIASELYADGPVAAGGGGGSGGSSNGRGGSSNGSGSGNGRRGTGGDPAVPLAAAAFVAFLPMHLAMNAAVNNDALAYTVMAAVIWLALGRALGRRSQRAFMIAGGLLLGLAFLTKLSIYGALPVLLAAELAGWWRRGRFGALLAAGTALQTAAIGWVIGWPWFMRNAVLYGAGDWFGTHRHDQVVTGQPTTVDWVHQFGWQGFLARMVRFTFESFWGVFGWLGVFLDERIYAALAAASGLAALGLARHLWRLRRAPGAAAADERLGLAVLAVPVLASVAGFVWWNLTFVQHQGRYLFPALVPLAIYFQLGVREVARLLAGALGWREAGTRRLEWAAMGGFSAGLALLAWISLTRYIVPGLS